jgi:3-oxoacyl-[acyl-carrier-protein] synthase-1
MNNALKQNRKIDITSKKTLIILSTTKGNIDLLAAAGADKSDKRRLYLWEAAQIIANHFKNPNKPVVISNACISGVLALITAKRLLGDNEYETIIVTGADILTPFVVSGFQSFKAISSQVAKPYDIDRDGISLGEASGTIILTNNKDLLYGDKQVIAVMGGASSNDANHISGPSRTGNGLLLAIQKTLHESGILAEDVDFISGHGTATQFNDEMESLAITDAHLQHVPVNSLKSYFGHTLGAAGIIEAVVGLQSMRENTLIATFNFTNPGVSKPINVIKQTTTAVIGNCLKTAVGFGGGNAAIFFQKQIIK